MEYNKKAIENKEIHLDEILKKREVLHRVIERNTRSHYVLEEIPRIWEPGGGATLFKIIIANKRFFLKVKHKSVTVESKLEEEKDFIEKSSLENEYEIFRTLANNGVGFIPHLLFFDEEDGLQFLAVEYIELSLKQKLEISSLQELLFLWEDLYCKVQKIYQLGIVHSDLHENNIRYREGDHSGIVIIDMEESRYLRQNSEFEESLDYIGFNRISSLGVYPNSGRQKYLNQYNSLLRLKEVFNDYVAKKTQEYLRECNYDSSSGICCALDHGTSSKTYQSIKNKYVQADGQRDNQDNRIELIGELCKLLMPIKFNFIDVGSNNGLFGRGISKLYKGGVRSIGLEGYGKFNILARSLAFLEDCNNIEYYDFICGEDKLNSLNIVGNCFVTICSVWHHIQNKNVFLEELRTLNIDYIFMELAVQEECYNGQSWQNELDSICDKLGFEKWDILGYSSDYNRPLILLQQKATCSRIIWKMKRITKKITRKKRV